jgi:hypothetical protein
MYSASPRFTSEECPSVESAVSASVTILPTSEERSISMMTLVSKAKLPLTVSLFKFLFPPPVFSPSPPQFPPNFLDRYAHGRAGFSEKPRVLSILADQVPDDILIVHFSAKLHLKFGRKPHELSAKRIRDGYGSVAHEYHCTN